MSNINVEGSSKVKITNESNNSKETNTTNTFLSRNKESILVSLVVSIIASLVANFIINL